jgi:sugar (pentulose or hexulose) kinase
VPMLAGTVVDKIEKRCRADLSMPNLSYFCCGMHDHVAAAYFGSSLSELIDIDAYVSSAGTTESIISLTNKSKRIIQSAPEYFLNSESTWISHRIAIVGFPTISGKLIQAWDWLDLKPDNLIKNALSSIIVIPPRKRQLFNDDGQIAVFGPLRTSFKAFLSNLVISAQMETRKTIEDTQTLLKDHMPSAILLFGGQSSNDSLSQLKSSLLQIPIKCLPDVNASALGVILRISDKNCLIDQEGRNDVLNSFVDDMRNFLPDDEVSSFSEEIYRCYNENRSLVFSERKSK